MLPANSSASVTATVLRPGAPGPPLAGSRGPGGTLALRRFLAARGLTVSDAADPPPGGGTFVLLADLRTYEQDSAILQWVDQGGRLVLADPLSELAFRLLVGSRGGLAAIRTTTTLGADCAAPEAVAAGAVEVRSSDLGLESIGADARGLDRANGGDRFMHCCSFVMCVCRKILGIDSSRS